MRYTDRLQYIFSDAIQGLNYYNAYLKWYDISNITAINNFVYPVTLEEIYGDWWQDDGDLALPDEKKENRLICKKGKAVFDVFGKTIILRLFLNPMFGSAIIKIDGAIPSTIPNVLDAKDIISTNSNDWNSDGNEYVDFVIADNLSNVNHTVELYCNNTDNGDFGYFALAGYKGINHSLFAGVDSYQRAIEAWILESQNQQSPLTIDFYNSGTQEIKNVFIKFPYILKDLLNNNIPDISLSSLSSLDSIIQSFNFNLNPLITNIGEEDVVINCQFEIQDDNGSISHSTNVVIDDTNTLITYTGVNWNSDTNNGETRTYTDTQNEYATVTIYGTSFILRIQREYGWGRIGVYVDAVFKEYVDCHDENGGGFYIDITISGLTDDEHVIKLNCEDASKFIVISSISYTKTLLYSLKTENIILNMFKKHVKPFDIENTQIQNKNIVGDRPDTTLVDLSLPKSNENVDKMNIYSRVPSFCVYYSSGKLDILKQYDIVIIDPFAITRKQVQELQAIGIKVIGYISFGEEDSTLTDIYNPNSELVPYVGDGLGVGGYASYYCKGDNEFGEVSECEFDNQRLLGNKTCAKANSNYLTSVGRCSKACWNDWREGYKTQRVGGNCSANHNKNDYWDRTATEACSNILCPDYDPINSHCSQYQKVKNVFGQDFSIMTTNFPDENGIWASYYINPRIPSWQQRIEDFYLPTVLGNSIERNNETCNISIWGTAPDDLPVCRIQHYPLDSSENVIVTNSDGSYIFEYGTEYTYNDKLGTFRFTLDGSSETLNDGDTVKISYTTKGLQCDGIFMDTVDTVDVYPSSSYKQAFINMINDLKLLYPNALFCSNRGFTILDDIIGSCEYVMFESFLSDYNWETETYQQVTDQETIDWNNSIIEQLKTLRETNTFDVFALNYCDNGSTGDTLREYIYTECRKLGFLCWTSTILLNEPLGNFEVVTNDIEITDNFKTNAWRIKNVESIS